MVMNPEVATPLTALLEACGIEENEETTEQLAVFLAALKLFEDRNKTYRNIWETYGALSNLLRSATKIDRAMEIWWHDQSDNGNPLLHKDNLDDAFDALNYLVFFIRCVRSGNITGSARHRPNENILWERQPLLGNSGVDMSDPDDHGIVRRLP